MERNVYYKMVLDQGGNAGRPYSFLKLDCPNCIGSYQKGSEQDWRQDRQAHRQLQAVPYQIRWTKDRNSWVWLEKTVPEAWPLRLPEIHRHEPWLHYFLLKIGGLPQKQREHSIDSCCWSQQYQIWILLHYCSPLEDHHSQIPWIFWSASNQQQAQWQSRQINQERSS